MYTILTAMASPAAWWFFGVPHALPKIVVIVYVSFTCDNTLFLASLTQRFRFVVANGLFGDHFA